MAVAGVLVPAALPASAASATIYLGSSTAGSLNNATDPHGGIWLPGTTDGKTNGPLNTSTDPTSTGFGHLWETDVVSGICRVDSVTAADGSTSQMYARSGAYPGAPASGGCIAAGQKDSQPSLDPRRNNDGTFFVYTCDWAVSSQGCYRLTYDPGAQLMKKSELLAPGRFPVANKGIKPFSTNLGADGNLYVTSDVMPYVYRITSPTQNTGNQSVAIVGVANTNTRIRAATFACWDPFRGGTTGLPSCAQSAAAGNPAPDLVLAEKTAVTVLMDVANCAGVPVDVTGNNGPIGSPACLAKPTKISALTPMGAYTQGAWDRPVVPAGSTGLPTWGPNLDANTIYISDSPGTTTQIIRYTINKDTQDSYSNFGVFPDGSMAQYSFGFSPTQSPDGRLFLGDDPSAGATSFNGRIWTVPAKAPADVLGSPGAAAAPPPLPAAKVGAIWGAGVTLPNDGIWLPGPAGTPGHLWIADGVSGFCRVDPDPTPGAAAPFRLNPNVCDLSTPKPGQPAFDPKHNYLYLPDQSTRGVGVIRVTYDPATETIVAGSAVTVAPGQGLDGQKTSGAAIEPVSGNLYVGFLNRNSTAPTEIARVHNPDSASPTVDFVANVTRHKPIFALAFVGEDLYIGNNGGLDVLPNPDACAPGACQSVQVVNTGGPRGMATDGTSIYMAAPSIPAGCVSVSTCPAPGTLNTPVLAYNPASGDLSTFSSQGMLADGTTLSQYDVVDSLTVDPSGSVYVADDPSAVGAPATQGRIFKVSSTAQEPLPAITSKPSNPTNQSKPTFAFQSTDAQATFQCSLVASTAADAFQACGSNGTGSVTYGTDASGAIVQNGANPIPDGAYVFRVQATSPSGTKSPVASYAFSISTAAPSVSITAQPTSPTNDTTPSYTFQSADPNRPLTFQCSLTPASGLDQFNPCTSPMTYPAQADGTYTFKVLGTDAASNQATASVTTVIDTVAPTVSASPAGGQYTSGQSVVVTASEPSTIYYTLDGTTPTTATTTNGASPLTVNVAASATLKYLAVDAAGNASQVGSQAYQIGSVGITQHPPALTNSTSLSFSFTDTQPGATFQCSLVPQSAADAFSACSSPKSYSNVADGAYRFVVQDNLGAQASYLLTVDTAPPTVMITQNPANPDTSSSATFAFTSNEAGTTFQCTFDASGAADVWNACTSPTTESNLADGSYVFKVKGTDAAGNTSAAESYPFMVSAGGVQPSATAPQAQLVGLTSAQSGTSATTSANAPLTATTNGVPVTISWTGTACQSGALNCNVDHYVLQQSINGQAFSNVSLPSPTATSVTLNLKPSPTNNSAPQITYRYQVQAVDKAGNLSPFAAGPTFSVPDTDNSFQSSYKGSWSGQNLNGAFNGSVQWSSTAGATANPSNPATVTSYAVVSTLGPDRGKAQISIDGGAPVTVDLYAPTQQTGQVVWSINGLQPGVSHTIQVVSTNTRNLASTGTRVDYDAILALK